MVLESLKFVYFTSFSLSLFLSCSSSCFFDRVTTRAKGFNFIGARVLAPGEPTCLHAKICLTNSEEDGASPSVSRYKFINPTGGFCLLFSPVPGSIDFPSFYFLSPLFFSFFLSTLVSGWIEFLQLAIPVACVPGIFLEPLKLNSDIWSSN